MRFGFVSLSLFHHKGGSERFSVDITREMALRGHECIIFHSKTKQTTPAYPLHEGVETLAMPMDSPTLIPEVKKMISDSKLDALCILFSTEFTILFLNIAKGTGIPLIISERSAPGAIEEIIWNRDERLACLSAADIIHLLSDRFLSSLPKFLHRQVRVISNPASISPSAIERKVTGRKRLLTVARLDESAKQLSLLITAFAGLAEQFPDWDCYICGGGMCYDVYTTMISNQGLDGRVLLMGEVDDVDSYYLSSELFCLPSAFEGFPNALVEAQGYGLPAVGFAGCSGVNEIIIHGENGLLASSMTAGDLKDSLAELMGDAALRKKMSEKSLFLLRRYDKQKVFDRWENILQEAASQKGNTKLDALSELDDKSIEILRNKLLCISPQERACQPVKEWKNAKIMATKLRSKLLLERKLCNRKR